jgi:hypothetical protein
MKSNAVSDKVAGEVVEKLIEHGFKIYWSDSIFWTLSKSIWGDPGLFVDMSYWIDERIQNFPEIYSQKSEQKHDILQAASDIFFCNIIVYPINHTIRPRQEDNLMIKCDRALKIWLTDTKYGSILRDEPALMKCPYSETLT